MFFSLFLLQISIYQAIAERIISQHQGLYRNPLTGEGMPIPEAMNSGLILVERTNRIVEMGELIKSGIIRTTTKRETVTYSVLSIRDPSSSEKMSIAEALRRGVINQRAGRYVTNLRSGESISIPAAIDRGFLEVEVIDKKILEPVAPLVDTTDSRSGKDVDMDGLLVTGVYDSSLGRQLSLEEAVKNGSVDLKTGVYINSVTGKKYPLAEAIKHGYLSVQLPGDEADDKDVIKRSTICNGMQSGPDLEELVEASSRRGGEPLHVDINHNAYQQLQHGVDVHCKGIVDPTSGRAVSIDEALNSGLLVLDPLGVLSADGSTMPLDEAVASDMIDRKLLHDMLTGLEQMSLEKMMENGTVDTDAGNYHDPDTGRVMSIVDAILSGKLDPYKIFYMDASTRSIVSLGTAIENGSYDPASGTFVDNLTGKKMRFSDAISAGLVHPAINANEVASRASVLKALGKYMDTSATGIKDPRTGEEISLSDAVMTGILDMPTGKYVNPQTGEKLSLSEAVDAQLISLDMAKQLLAAMDENSLAKSNIDVRTGEYVDAVTQQRMSVQEAIDRGYIEPAAVFLVDSTSAQFMTLASLMENYNDSVNDDIGNCRFDAATGTFVNGQTGEMVNLADAISSGFISPGLEVEKMSTNMTVLKALGDHVDTNLSGIRDPRTGEDMSLPEAIMAGIIDLSSGEIVNVETGERLSITDAIAAEQVSLEMGKQLLSAMNRNSLANSNIDLATGKYVDPETQQSMSVEEAIRLGFTEPAAVFMVDPVSGQLASLATLIDNGSFNPITGKIRNSTTGLEISVATAERNGLAVADFSVDSFIPPEKLSVKDLINSKRSDVDESAPTVFVTPGGQKMSLQDAVTAGFITGETAVQVDRKSGTVSLVDQSQGELVDALGATKSIEDWLDDVEQRLSRSSRMELENTASVHQEIASLDVRLLRLFVSFVYLLFCFKIVLFYLAGTTFSNIGLILFLKILIILDVADKVQNIKVVKCCCFLPIYFLLL